MSIENVGKEGNENRKNEARMQKGSPLVAPNKVGEGRERGKVDQDSSRIFALPLNTPCMYAHHLHPFRIPIHVLL